MKDGTRDEYTRIYDAIVSTKAAVEAYLNGSWVEYRFRVCMRLCFELGRLYAELSREDWNE